MLENVQEILDEFKANVINEAKRNLSAQNTSGRLRDSLKGYVKESKNSIQVSFERNRRIPAAIAEHSSESMPQSNTMTWHQLPVTSSAAILIYKMHPILNAPPHSRKRYNAMVRF